VPINHGDEMPVLNFRIRVACLGLAAAFAGGLLMTTPAEATRPNGYAVTNVNQRAGPGTEYPVLLTVPRNGPVSILGCLPDHAWCETYYRGSYGWMSAIYLMGYHDDGYYALRDYAPQMDFPVVRFEIGGYWDKHYRNRDFYRERDRWGPRRQDRGPRYRESSSFYGPLRPYGDWVWFQGQYVWVPTRVDRGWQPYTMGRWAYTRPYGWMWVSNEPFGWATYHYGRWGYSRRMGWFWVPGNRWGPAWVSWRQTDDYLAWAPLPPGPSEYASIQIGVGAIPDYYWQVVPTQSFLSVNVGLDIVRDRDRRRRVVERSKPLGNVTIVNNNVVNNVVNVTYVEQKTEEKVVALEVSDTAEAKDSGEVVGDKIEVYVPPEPDEPEELAPPEVKTIAEVEKASPTVDQVEGDEPTTENLLLPEEVKPAEDAPPPAASIDEAKPEEVPAEAEKAIQEAPDAPPALPDEVTPPAPEDEAPPPPEEVPPPATPEEEPAPVTPDAPKPEPTPEPTPEPAPEPEPAPTPQAAPEEKAPPKPEPEPAPVPEEKAPPPPPVEEPAPPVAEPPAPPKVEPPKEIAPPPPPPPVEEPAPPPPAAEPVPPPPPPPVEEPAPAPPPVQEKAPPKRDPKPDAQKEAPKREQPEQKKKAPPPEEATPPPPPPPPPAEMPEEIQPQVMPAPVERQPRKQEVKQKEAPPKQKQQESKQRAPQPLPVEVAPELAPMPPADDRKARRDRDGGGKKQQEVGGEQQGQKGQDKGKRQQNGGSPCPEGMMPTPEGECLPIQ
jgi:uncharacterized protein YraI